MPGNPEDGMSVMSKALEYLKTMAAPRHEIGEQTLSFLVLKGFRLT